MSEHDARPILPGATLGVLGSGQLGRMFALAAREMGYRIHVYSPVADSPTGQVADREFVGSYDDLELVGEFAATCDAVTLEFENVPTPAARTAAQRVPVRPSADVLHTIQHRAREKGTLRDAGIAVTPFKQVTSLEELRAAIDELGTPGVLKTSRDGYDGLGQRVVSSVDDAEAAWTALGSDDTIYEAFINFDREVSVVAARGADGAFTTFEPFENDHADHILDVTFVPARLADDVRRQARSIAAKVVELLDVVGVLCVEFFVQPDGTLLVNELAPRPHNSGHLTIDACASSQFDLQVRALCGLPLSDTTLLKPAAMANLLGDLWAGGEPPWTTALTNPALKLHLYGKADARPGRKMGHICATAETVEAARRAVLEARERLRSSS
jgi:5-(carboxyamino)imidazole ribonucleotide synthase